MYFVESPVAASVKLTTRVDENSDVVINLAWQESCDYGTLQDKLEQISRI